MTAPDTSAAERKRIRGLVVAQLAAKSIGALTGHDAIPSSRIYSSRVYPIAPKHCPALNVFTPSQDGKNESRIAHVPTFDYDMRARVDIVLAVTDGWDDIGDDLASEVEAAIMQDTDFLASVGISYFSWHNTTIRASGEGEEVTATIAIEFGMNFGWTYDPVASDAFEGADIDVDAIDPADANTGHENDPGGYPGGYPGPDGRIEAEVTADPEQ